MRKFDKLYSAAETLSDYLNSFSGDIDEVHVKYVTASFDEIFELAWKAMKEYLFREQGYREASSGSPKAVIKVAFRDELISDEDGWLKILEDRNDDAHVYKLSVAIGYLHRIEERHCLLVRALIEEFEKRGIHFQGDDADFYQGMPKELFDLLVHTKISEPEVMIRAFCKENAISEDVLYRDWGKWRKEFCKIMGISV